MQEYFEFKGAKIGDTPPPTIQAVRKGPKDFEHLIGLLHGSPGGHIGYPIITGLMDALSDKHMVFAYNQRGMGIAPYTSDGKFEEKTMTVDLADLSCGIDSILERTGRKGLVLGGHSAGSLIAQLFNDPRVYGKVLMSGSPSTLDAFLGDFNTDQFLDFLRKGRITYPKDAPHPMAGKRLNATYELDGLSHDIAEKMAKYKGPILILHGKHDNCYKIEKARDIQTQHGKDSSIYEEISAGHLLGADKPNGEPWQQVINAWKEFLDQIPGENR